MDSEQQGTEASKSRAPRRLSWQMAVEYLSKATIDDLARIAKAFKAKSPRSAEFMRNELSGNERNRQSEIPLA